VGHEGDAASRPGGGGIGPLGWDRIGEGLTRYLDGDAPYDWREAFERDRPWVSVRPTGTQTTMEQAIYTTAISWCLAQQLVEGVAPSYEEVAEEIRRRRADDTT
jgi:hypothetical protein